MDVPCSINIKITLKQISHENSVTELNVSQNIKFAVLRRDILWQIQNNKYNNLKSKYITVALLPIKAQLYLYLTNRNANFDFLLGDKVSIGKLEDRNGGYLKSILDIYDLRYSVLFKSLSYQKSIDALKNGAIDAFFFFSPKMKKIDSLYRQTMFSAKIISYFDNLGIFDIDYDGVFSPYVLIAAADIKDQEIEAVLYRLMEKKMFEPITDIRYGKINQKIFQHLEHVKEVLETKKDKKNQKNNRNKTFKVCKTYHYGFLKLLRKKPYLKKKLEFLHDSLQRRAYTKQIDDILLSIDMHKDICDLVFLRHKEDEFNAVEKRIYESL